uniref:Spindle and centriole-associated protein 1 n=1 Tax=Strongyloides papillosus TaxID=174720 RepID=A0A0N5BAB6_STREA
MTTKADNLKNSEYPRQLIQVTKSNKSDDVVRTELRFVSYDLKTNLEQRFGSSEGSAVTQALWSLLTHLNKLNKDGDATEDDLLMQKQILEIQLEKARNNLESNEKYMREMMEMLKESEKIIKHEDACVKPKRKNRSVSVDRVHYQQPTVVHKNDINRKTKVTRYQAGVISETSYIEPSMCEVITERNNNNCHRAANVTINDKVSLSNSMCQALHDISNRVMQLQASSSSNDPIFKGKIKNVREMVDNLRELLLTTQNGSEKISIKILKNKFEILTSALNNLYNQHLKNQSMNDEGNGGFTKRTILHSSYYKKE